MIRVRIASGDDQERIKEAENQQAHIIKMRIVKILIFLIAVIIVFCIFVGAETSNIEAAFMSFMAIAGFLMYAALPLIGVCFLAWIVTKIIK